LDIAGDFHQPFVKITFPSGDYYEGTFLDNQGEGVYVKANGDFYRVTLNNGKFKRIKENANRNYTDEVIEAGTGTENANNVDTATVPEPIKPKNSENSENSEKIPIKFENRIENLPKTELNLTPLLEKRIQLKLNQINCLKFANALKNLPKFKSLNLTAFSNLLSELSQK
jgi:hypothetical protein